MVGVPISSNLHRFWTVGIISMRNLLLYYYNFIMDAIKKFYIFIFKNAMKSSYLILRRMECKNWSHRGRSQGSFYIVPTMLWKYPWFIHRLLPKCEPIQEGHLTNVSTMNGGSYYPGLYEPYHHPTVSILDAS